MWLWLLLLLVFVRLVVAVIDEIFTRCDSSSICVSFLFFKGIGMVDDDKKDDDDDDDVNVVS